MGKKLLPTLIAGLFAAAPAFAQSDDDPMRVKGTVTFGYIYNNQSADDKAKLQEYQDLGNGVPSSVAVHGRNSTTWFEGYGENFGRDDQYMFLRGGMYDIFKAGAYLNWMPHDFSTNALTPYNGVGGGLLTTTFPQLDTSTWTSFNLGYQRKDAGGYFEWQKNSPWYFRVDGNQVKFEGTRPGSASNGTSPGNGYVALALPTQTSTKNVGVEGGYQTSKATYSVRWDYSKFDNSLDSVLWTNPFFGNQLDATQLPPDNTFNKLTLTGNYRDLPWNSQISARYTWAKTTSNVNLLTSQLNSFPSVAANNFTNPSEGTFNGENVNQSLALGWTAHPIANVDTRVYYYWTKLQNKSDDVTYGNAPVMPLRERPQLRERSAGCRISSSDGMAGRQLRAGQVQLQEEQRRLRRVLAFCAGSAGRLRLRLLEHRSDPSRLRQGARQFGLRRVQEHGVRDADGQDQVPLHQA